MIRIKTGETIFELIESVDVDNNPVPSATFNSTFFIDGVITTGVTLNIFLSDSATGIFQASFSGNTFGFHQFRLKNNITNVLYISDNYDVNPDSQVDTSPTIYVGL